MESHPLWFGFFAYLFFGTLSTVGITIRLLSLNKKRINKQSIGEWSILMMLIYALWPVWNIYVLYTVIKDGRNKIVCPWCNERVDFTNIDSVQEHVTKCQKHPTLTEIAKLQTKIYYYEHERERFYGNDGA
jgi:hypothetical protein